MQMGNEKKKTTESVMAVGGFTGIWHSLELYWRDKQQSCNTYSFTWWWRLQNTDILLGWIQVTIKTTACDSHHLDTHQTTLNKI